MKVKKNLSIEDDLLKEIEDRAKSLKLNFTTYIQILVNQDLGRDGIDHPEVGVNRILREQNYKKPKQPKKEDVDMSLYRNAAKEAMALMDNM